MRGIVITQLGARQHYELARSAQREGELARLITDFWNPLGRRSVELTSWLKLDQVARVAGRRCENLPRERVISLPAVALRSYWHRRTERNRRQVYLAFIADGKDFATRVTRFLDIDHDVFLGFASASLESVLYEKRQGRRTVLDQIDGARVEARIVCEEERRFPSLVPESVPIPEEYFKRLDQEWSEAHSVVVNSNWVRQALICQGVPAEKILVIPVAMEPPMDSVSVKSSSSVLKVLWLGTMTIRKGLPYAVEGARLLEGKPVRFTFAGPLDIKPSGLAMPANSEWIGPVPRNQTASLYRTHDVLLFPTLSDGFGITQLEAMARGLPVIATTQCGDVVQHNVSGFIVQDRNPKGIADAITALLDEPARLAAMSGAALRRSQDFAPSRIWPKWQATLWPE